MTRTTTILDFICEITNRDKWHNLAHALRSAKGRELWEWQIDALAFELSEPLPSSRTMAKALVAMIGAEATRRLGPKSVDNPEGWEETNEAPETRTGDAQLPLEVGGALD